MKNIVSLGNGIDGMYIQSNRFKTTRISISFFLPLMAETISANTILPSMLTTSSAKYSNYRMLQTKLSNLYGASLNASSGKVGDSQIMTISLTSLDDKFVNGQDKISGECAELLTSLIFEPNFDESGNFKDEDIAREKRLLLETIESELNNKRIYALNRAESALFEGHVYGLPQYGTIEGAKSLTAADILAAWKRLLHNAYVKITVIGSQDPENIFSIFAKQFSMRSRDVATLNIFEEFFPSEKLKRVTEPLDIAQGKLVMEFTTGVTGSVISTAAFSVMCDIFGGGPYSRLFSNVREKLSLCYYCAARSNRFKGTLVVDSGVEKQNAEAAEKEILNQIEIMKKGSFTDDELKASILAKTDRFRSMFDSQRETESFYMSQAFDDTTCTMEELINAVQSVTREQVVDAAKGMELALTYMLTPKEDASNE